MATINLKESVLQGIENADDRLLRLIKALVDTYQQDQDDDLDITDEQKKCLINAWQITRPILKVERTGTN